MAITEFALRDLKFKIMDILSGLSIIFLTQHMHKRNENLKLYLKYRVFIVTKYAFIRILFFEVTNNK